ncbi:uncharacterized protein A4U43_C04F18110 [Asparagus officinalis]|uniref:HIRAN domain-containing protein n=1 Tax=Asparagus officinalis TaxID=4686 RepID=A0A5P1F746_ASPOF|nr:uncharacterized protein A4U43_C04F18110 [Asparagus officinalis]
MPPSLEESEALKPKFLLAEEIASIRSVIGGKIPESKIIGALTAAGNNPDRAVGILLDSPELIADPKPVEKEVESELPIKATEPKIVEKDTEVSLEEEVGDNSSLLESNIVSNKKKQGTKVEMADSNRVATPKKEALEEYEKVLARSHCAPYLNPRPIRAIKPETVTDRRIQLVPEVDAAEFAEFPEEDNWVFIGRAYVAGLSTCRGKKKIDPGEIVYFTFPKTDFQKQYGRRWVRVKAAAASSEIVRFSTKRAGEIGKLPPEWSRCLIPLVNSSKVKVKGRCVTATTELRLMQDFLLYVSLYIHNSIFTEGDKSSFKLEASAPIDPNVCPLPTLFRLMKMKPVQKAEFTPEDLDSGKRTLSLRVRTSGF